MDFERLDTIIDALQAELDAMRDALTACDQRAAREALAGLSTELADLTEAVDAGELA